MFVLSHVGASLAFQPFSFRLRGWPFWSLEQLALRASVGLAAHGRGRPRLHGVLRTTGGVRQGQPHELALAQRDSHDRADRPIVSFLLALFSITFTLFSFSSVHLRRKVDREVQLSCLVTVFFGRGIDDRRTANRGAGWAQQGPIKVVQFAIHFEGSIPLTPRVKLLGSPLSHGHQKTGNRFIPVGTNRPTTRSGVFRMPKSTTSRRETHLCSTSSRSTAAHQSAIRLRSYS